MTTKVTHQGTNPQGLATDTTKKDQKASKPTNQHNGKKAKPVSAAAVKTALSTRKKGVLHQDPSVDKMKATYYLSPVLIKKLKHISVDLDRDLSDLVSEAITGLVVKYTE